MVGFLLVSSVPQKGGPQQNTFSLESQRKGRHETVTSGVFWCPRFGHDTVFPQTLSHVSCPKHAHVSCVSPSVSWAHAVSGSALCLRAPRIEPRIGCPPGPLRGTLPAGVRPRQPVPTFVREPSKSGPFLQESGTPRHGATLFLSVFL